MTASKLLEHGFTAVLTVIVCTWAVGLVILVSEVVKMTSSL